MGWSRRILAVGLVAAFLAVAALAQEVRRISLAIMVTHASSSPGPVDPPAARLDSELRRDFRYRSLRVLERRQMTLRMDEVGHMQLPNGRALRVRPLNVAGDRLLMAVEVEGAVDTDLRLRNHKKVSIGSHRWKDGTLVITLEPDF